MDFATTVNGIPCLCRVHEAPEPATYSPVSLGLGPDPQEDVAFVFELLDSSGYRARWIEQYLTPEIEQQLFEDYRLLQQAEAYGY